MFPHGDAEFRDPLSRPPAAAADQKQFVGPVIGVLAIGMLLGFVMGWVSFASPLSNGSGGPALYDEALVTSIFEKASPAVVEIGTSGFGAPSAGSGFFVDNQGHIVTSAHVVAGDPDLVVTLHDGRDLVARKLGSSRADDIAVIKVDAAEVAGIAPLHLADSDGVRPGQLAVAIGSPYRNLNSVSVGVVSGIGREQTSILRRPIPDLVQTDAALNPGNSGGPLLNEEGEVIGVNSSVRIESGVQIGVGFAVPSKTVEDILPHLMRAGEFNRPWLGINGIPLNESRSNALGIHTDAGIYIVRVCPGSPAQEIRLRDDPRMRGGGDVITAVDGTDVRSIADMVSHLNTISPGDLVRLSVTRNNSARRIDVRLAEWQSCV